MTIQLITEKDRKQARQQLDVVPIVEGYRRWEMVLRPIPQHRTLNQNTRLHTLFGLVAAATGNTVPAVKQAYKEMFLVPTLVMFRRRMVKVWPRTRDMSIEEMNLFFMQVSGDAAAEHGVMLMPQD